jgi:hypothetical protein
MKSRSYFMEVARVPEALQPQSFGLWDISRAYFQDYPETVKLVGWPNLTMLCRWTNGTMHLDRGECVMEDSRTELARHLPIWMEATGRVLVTGLGLGCVIRGLLAKPEVDHIDVIEIDPGIIGAIGPEFAGDTRLTINCGDALTFNLDAQRWDYAWHDIWSDTGSGEPHLQCLHAKLIAKYFEAVKYQGAWGFPRKIAKRIKISLLGSPEFRRRKP